jgi:nitronate monooxygenase
MPLPEVLQGRLRLPVVGAPMFIVSNPDLVIEQCKAGIVGSFPALNARPKAQLEVWLERITSELAAFPGAAPYAVNQIIHGSNERLAHDMEVCERFRVPVIITSLRAPDEIVPRVHGWGGVVFHDVIGVRHARRAMQAGVDGLILVCAGGGGHAGTLSPFALVHEVRRFFHGTILLAGAIATGEAVLAAQAAGADLAYIGTRFIATREANAKPEYKQMIVESAAGDIVYTPLFTGVHGNYLKKSVVAAGLDPEHLPTADKSSMNFGSAGNVEKKAWRDIWGAGQGVGCIDDAPPAADVVARLEREYRAARARLAL